MLVKSGEKPAAEEAYRKSAFNERCDLVYERAGNTMPLGYDTAVPIDFSAVTVAEDFAEEVNSLTGTAEAKGASVVISFSPMNRSAVTDPSDEAVLRFFNLINETFTAPAVSDPNDYILDSGWFYDSNFHLNSAGARVRTALLGGDLLAYWGCTAPVALELPDMPQSVSEVSETTAGDPDAFKFAPLADEAGYLISGLSEQGTKKLSLTVPSEYEGKPVVGFTADALEKAALLEELTLSASIESLPDGLFAHTSELVHLVLLHRTALPAVGEKAFDACPDLKIFVPKEDYSMYRDGAGCAQNPWEPYLDRIVTY